MGKSDRVFKKCSFSGPNKCDTGQVCDLSIQNIFKSKIKLLLVGTLEELVCETPLEDECDAFDLVPSRKKPVVVASDDGKYVLIVSANKITSAAEPGDVLAGKVTKAADLHTDFHGTAPKEIKKIGLDETDCVLFFGHLNYIVYSVPQYSERRGVPFIHEARDRGDGVPKAKKKPTVCVSPNRDFVIMYGTEFRFTDRGIIG